VALNLADRLLTIAVTATLTSAAWIVVGSTYVDRVDVPLASPTPAPRPASVATPEVATEPLLIPVAGIAASQLSDTFGDARSGERRHEALDIAAPAGTPVIAAAGGTIEKLFRSDDGGNTVYVRSPDRGTLYYYAHLQAYAPGLEEGEAVARGQRLGTVGSSGNADPSTPHLHFAVMRTDPDAEWWKPATAINPYPLLTGEQIGNEPKISARALTSAIVHAAML
jgi:murein DD-endopeptidase MepM/ murein hydrolase activator NlpD